MAGRVGVVLLASLMFGAACGSGGPTAEEARAPSLKGPQKYRVNMDGPSSPENNFVFGAYFPKTIKARPGDTIVVANRSSHDIHTVTLGVHADRTNSPKPETRAVQANPVVFGPCFTESDPDPEWEECPTPAAPAEPDEAPAFSGKGYWNSGAILPPLLAGEKAPTASTLKLGDRIPAGSYAMVCLIHPFMNGELEIVEKDTERLSPAAVAKAADKQFEEAEARSGSVEKPAVEPGAVLAGWGDEVIAVDVFAPSTASVKAGDTVTWVSKSPYMPHTVSFAPPVGSPVEPNAFLPAGAKSGSPYEGGTAHSGMIGPPPFPATSFSLRFTKPGTYQYVCVLHPRMSGAVEVAPS